MSRSELRDRLARSPALVVPGAYDALTARLVAQSGFEAVYVTGAGFANSSFGVPDLELFGLSDLVTHVQRIVDAVNVPVIVDADTGYGGVLNIYRTVRQLERAGVASIQLEDQVSPKRCGHFDGTRVIAAADMVPKIHAAVDARTDTDLLLIIRTDARRTEGLDAAIDRANLYADAGADLVFVEAPRTIEELQEIPRRVKRPAVANMVEGGMTPLLDGPALTEMGYAMAIFANTALRASLKATTAALRALHEHQGSLSILDSLASWEERQASVGLAEFQALEDRFLEGHRG